MLPPGLPPSPLDPSFSVVQQVTGLTPGQQAQAAVHLSAEQRRLIGLSMGAIATANALRGTNQR